MRFLCRLWAGCGLILLLGISACSEQFPGLPGPTLAEVFPDSAGFTRTYEVLDSTYDAAGGHRRDSRRRETLGDTVPDLTGRFLRQLQIDTANAAGTNYAPYAIWRQYLNKPQAEVFEGNERVIVMAAPIQRANAWNGNRFNTRNGQLGSTTDTTFRYLSTDTTIVVLGQTYANCVLVQQRRSIPGTLLFDIWTHVFYAPGIGKVLQVDRFYLYQTIGPNRQPVSGSYLHIERLIESN